MHRLRRMLIVFALTLAAAAPVRAQAAAAAGAAGLWGTLSAGRGDLQVNCAICRETPQRSWSALVALGGSLGPRVKVGGELGAWRRGGDEATQRIMLVGAVGQLYPVPAVPAYVRLGVGLMNYQATDGDESLGARSLALQAGFGYDLPVARRFVLVPHATLVHGMGGGLYLDGQEVTASSRLKLLQFGLGVGVR